MAFKTEWLTPMQAIECPQNDRYKKIQTHLSLFWNIQHFILNIYIQQNQPV